MRPYGFAARRGAVCCWLETVKVAQTAGCYRHVIVLRLCLVQNLSVSFFSDMVLLSDAQDPVECESETKNAYAVRGLPAC
jgi:hypothetical protein